MIPENKIARRKLSLLELACDTPLSAAPAS